MATKSARGTKRTCQNQECGARFYDLNREPITCPMCESEYTIAHQSLSPAAAAAAAAAEEKAARKAKKLVDDAAAEVVPGDGEEALADLEVAEEPIAAEGDETFLEEEEEEGGDVSGIIGGPVAEGGEEV
jgi:uncharacterized protein (TIGR02300 family)